MGLFKNKYELGRVEILFIVLVLAALLGVAVFALKTDRSKKADITSFADCVAAGNPVMESYPEQCVADGRNFTNPDQNPVNKSGEEANPLFEQAIQVHYAELPDELKTVVVGHLKEKGSSCLLEGRVVDVGQEEIKSDVTYASMSSALIPVGCNGGSVSLFALDKSAKWVFVEETQDLFNCNSVTQYPIPKSLLEVGMSGRVSCFNDPTQSERDYDTLYY